MGGWVIRQINRETKNPWRNFDLVGPQSQQIFEKYVNTQQQFRMWINLSE